ncbi:WD40 repeat-like protein [Polychaeton citri CBS 116435]|uniref:WD40 repeat-like protein n=1 Tax=Polychaeton citri CBS 116435 TaxID=1314669 RepID=A0A9P4QH45_9PEZI|nr:WD40 repeat-like protein [Polychaeton citri CBS 116435]
MASPGNSETWQEESSEFETGDDDMDFELASSDVTPSAAGEDEEDEGETTLYFDAEEGVLRTADGTAATFAPPEDQDAIEEEGAQTPQPAEEEVAGGQQPRTHAITITQQQILQLLNSAGLSAVFQSIGGPTTRSAGANTRHAALADDNEEQADDDDDDGYGYLGYGRRRRRPKREFVGDRYPPIPSEEGKRLMASGEFGTNDRCDHTACGIPFSDDTQRKRRRLARRLFDREMGVENRGRARVLGSLASHSLLPSSKADVIVNLNARCYSGQFSEDGSFFFACGQDYKVRMYDTSNPYDWKYYKTVHYYGGQWTITDASLSPDNRHLAYSSIRSQVYLANTDPSDTGDPQLLDFSNSGSGGSSWGRSLGHFGIWSLRFSGDGSEIVAGTSDESVYVYDLEAQRSILRIPGHTDDVNAVCFGDKMSPHILYSGSDDTTLKVWDRRSLSSMRPAGMFLGHTEGLTYIDSKGDGRYVISNAKDQTCKLWDLRKMISTDAGEKIDPQDYTTNFDYRFSPYYTEEHEPHPHDCSLVTFRGHRVLKTLIRCHFSPAESTNGRYIYSGSHDGKVYIWNLDGTTAGTINVFSATKNSRPSADERFVSRYDFHGRGGAWKTIVRDCSWHPSAPVIAATSWNGWDHGLGTCTVHTWNDGADGDEVGDRPPPKTTTSSDIGDDDDDGTQHFMPKDYAKAQNLGSAPMGARVTAQLKHDSRLYGVPPDQEQSSTPRRSTRLRDRMPRGAVVRGEDEDDEDEGEL